MPPAPLRILHVAPYYEDAWAYGGIPRVAAAMARGLAGRGHQVTVCSTDACDALRRTPPRQGRSHGVDVRLFPNLSNRLAYHLQFFTPIGLRGWLRRHAGGFDVAHLHACHNLPAAYAAASLARAGVPFVLSPNGTARPIERRVAAKRLFAATAGRRLLPGAARVLAVTETERRQLADLGVPLTRIAILPNPVDLSEQPDAAAAARFRAAHAPGGVPLVLFLGKLTPRKGVLDLIRAFAQLPCRDARLVVAGNDMGTGREADAMTARLGLTGRVVRTGLLEGPARLAALQAADVVVYPSRDEIFGLVPIEALLCGTPVVVCADSGCGEIIQGIGGGTAVPPGAPAALAAAVEAVLGDLPAWRLRAAAAASLARRRFGADVVAGALEGIYEEVAGRRAVRRPA